jgi:hypothetical protein
MTIFKTGDYVRLKFYDDIAGVIWGKTQRNGIELYVVYTIDNSFYLTKETGMIKE